MEEVIQEDKVIPNPNVIYEKQVDLGDGQVLKITSEHLSLFEEVYKSYSAYDIEQMRIYKGVLLMTISGLNQQIKSINKMIDNHNMFKGFILSKQNQFNRFVNRIELNYPKQLYNFVNRATRMFHSMLNTTETVSIYLKFGQDEIKKLQNDKEMFINAIKVFRRMYRILERSLYQFDKEVWEKKESTLIEKPKYKIDEIVEGVF